MKTCRACKAKNSGAAEVCSVCGMAFGVGPAEHAPVVEGNPGMGGIAMVALILGATGFVLGPFTAVPALLVGLLGPPRPEEERTAVLGRTLALASLGLWLLIIGPTYLFVASGGHLRTCLANQREIAMQTQFFADGHDGHFPAAATYWTELGLAKEQTRCPSRGDDRIGYDYNRALALTSLAEIAANPVGPAQVIVCADGDSPGKGLAEPANFAFRHRFRCIAGFLDGHMQTLSRRQIAFGSPYGPTAMPAKR